MGQLRPFCFARPRLAKSAPGHQAVGPSENLSTSSEPSSSAPKVQLETETSTRNMASKKSTRPRSVVQYGAVRGLLAQLGDGEGVAFD